ncbi:MAG: hypothetical protein BZY88_07805 [SAR202 cluster bacterium Io17-Chloro-G9]|nr:MAG: hypothetical protein BZY88_07805 [SAR202 cluster bacterium Io17-Chloro-G9]
MIPVRLDVQNFLCYREGVPTLDFTGIHLACLCGPNGHGKSALLDAITWCLWGKARGRSQDELISYGADECRVQFDYSARDENYRVIRSHSRGGGRRQQGATDLQLQVLSGGEATAVTGNTIRESQAKIEQTLGMDYETFINSAFLLQGRADEFTNKTPADRKAVLAKILSLQTYDLLQDRARVRLNQASSAATELSGRLGEMRRQVDEIGDPTEELVGIELHLSRVGEDLERHREETDGLRRQVAQLESRQDQLTAMQSRMEILRRDLEQLDLDQDSYQKRIDQLQQTVDQAGSIRQGLGRLVEARDLLHTMEQARDAYDQLNQQRAPLVLAIQESRIRIETQVQGLKGQVETELPAKAKLEPELTSQLEEVRRREVELESQSRELARSRENAQALAAQVGEAKSTALRYESEGKELNTKLELLQRGDTEGAVCPLCQTPLDQDRCGRLAEVYQNQVAEKRDLYRQNRDRLNQVEIELENLEKDLPVREQALTTEQRQSDSHRQDLERRIQESRQAQQELVTAKASLQSLQEMLDVATYAVDEQASLAQLDLDIKGLNYDDQARQAAYQQTRELQPFEDQGGQLDHALESLPREQESLARAQEMLGRHRDELARLTLDCQAEIEVSAQLPQLELRLKEAAQAVSGLEAQRETAVARQGYLKGQLARREELLQDVQKGAARQVDLEADQGTFQELVNAFGRQGVQAMLIETAVPQLEEETNVLLGRMTDNRMHIKLETQRERRTGHGDPIETLEINVNDELGPRSYEMYSGGEAFRINLALRVALSKVLAQRVGAPLPTLFIDEGFGTQDASGRERILDVIGAIQSDFEKIIVITHLEDIKDVFPVRIEVQKGREGSTVWLN